uniref:Uncharacterized protein n=1 Tax=Timema monikensis TaxID=170555 RepID=A0A7R9HT43_9NEOP|nr:unnamed protein product [Timema monikensis]
MRIGLVLMLKPKPKMSWVTFWTRESVIRKIPGVRDIPGKVIKLNTVAGGAIQDIPEDDVCTLKHVVKSTCLLAFKA